jgi:hypothetical protein
MGAMPPAFVPSLQLNADFYREIVAPLVGSHPHAAALLGWGSDVLGYDTERSTDHGWGPRLQIFVDADDVEPVGRMIEARLPEDFRGWPVRYGWDNAEVTSRVDVLTVGDWLRGQLGFDPRAGMTPVDWLTVSQQQLLGVVRGAVYADPAGELAAVRRSLTWFPHDVWLWILASQWGRIGQEVAFVGRTAEVGDELGSRLLASRLVRELMCLAFLLDREYWPYTKWFGTAFSRLRAASDVGPALERAVAADDYPTREQALVDAYALVAKRHNASGITAEVDPGIGGYFSRPYRVVAADRFAEASRAAITDPWLRALPLVGSVDQFVDSTDVLSSSGRTHHLRAFYERL